MNRLVLIRHAQSEHHARGLTGGWTDTPLTEFGQAQAALLAEHCRQSVPHEPAPLLFSSDLLRAAQTAQRLSDALELPCRMEPALREWNNGVAAGLTLEEAKLLERPMTHPPQDWLLYPEAESWRMMTARVFGGMERIAADCDATAIVVTHGNSGIAVLQWWLQLCESCRPRIAASLAPASLTLLETNEWQERVIVKLNDTSHLNGLKTH